MDAFLGACEALSSRGDKAASEYLQQLRESSASIPLATATIESQTTTAAAKMHASMLLRDCALRHWDSLGLEQQRYLREWAFNCAVHFASLPTAEQLSAHSNLVSMMVTVVAVFWKRGWLSEVAEHKQKFVHQISSLLSGAAANTSALAVRLVSTMIGEFDLSSASWGSAAAKVGQGRFTALGVSVTFHRDSASEFQSTALLPLLLTMCSKFVEVAKPLCDDASYPAGPAHQWPQQEAYLLELMLKCLCDVFGWDFEGSARGTSSMFRLGGSAATRPTTVLGTPIAIKLPAGPWNDLLRGAGLETLLNTASTVYSRARLQSPSSRVAERARTLLVHLCSIEEPKDATSPGSALAATPSASSSSTSSVASPTPSPSSAVNLPFTAACGSSLAQLLKSPLSSMLEPLQQASSATASAGGWKDKGSASLAAYNEIRDLAVAASTLFSRLGGPLQLCRVAEGRHMSTVVMPLLEGAFGVTNHLASTVITMAGQVNAAVASCHGNASLVEAARDRVESFLEGDYPAISEAIEACLDLWQACAAGKMSALSTAEAAVSAGLPGANGFSGSDELDETVSLPLLRLMKGAVAGVYSSIIKARIELETAIVRCEVNNDDPMEDVSLLVESEQRLAVLGRFVPNEAIAALLELLGQSFSQFQAFLSSSASASAGGDLGTEGAACCEALWWLAGHSTYLLSDSGYGEVATVPLALNVLSKASTKHLHAMASSAGATHAATGAAIVPREVQAQNDPVTRLVCAVFSVAHFESQRLSGFRGKEPSSMSPFLYARLLWAMARLAGTYLLPDLNMYVHNSLPPAISACFATDAGDAAALEAAVASAASAFYHRAALVSQSLFGPAAAPPASIGPTGPWLATTNNGLLVVAAAPALYGGGRSILELLLHAAVSALTSFWAGTEPLITEKAISLIHTLSKAPGPARYCAVSPTWAYLSAAFSLLIANGSQTRDVASHLLQNESNAGDHEAIVKGAWAAACPWVVAAPDASVAAGLASSSSSGYERNFRKLSAESQADLLTALLGITRRIGEEVPTNARSPHMLVERPPPGSGKGDAGGLFGDDDDDDDLGGTGSNKKTPAGFAEGVEAALADADSKASSSASVLGTGNTAITSAIILARSPIAISNSPFAPVASLAVLHRWKRYYDSLVNPAQARMHTTLSLPELAAVAGRAPHASPVPSPSSSVASLPVVISELERLLRLHAAIIQGHDHKLPHTWHINATAGALVGCSAVVKSQGAQGPACTAALTYISEFLDPDASPMGYLSAPQVEAAFAAITAVFEGYGAVHAGRLAALAAASSGKGTSGQLPQQSPSAAAAAQKAAKAEAATKASAGDMKHTRGSGAASSSASSAAAVVSVSTGVKVDLGGITEEEICEAVKILLTILQRMIGLEDLNFITSLLSSSSSSSAADASGNGGAGKPEPDDHRISRVATAAIVAGLSFIVPVMSSGLLEFPALAQSYIGVVSGLISGHPSQVAALQPSMFQTLVSSLLFGIRHHDEDIAVESMNAVQVMANYHASCARSAAMAAAGGGSLTGSIPGAGMLPGLLPQLSHMPSLWTSLLSALFGALVGPVPPSQSTMTAGSDALIAVIDADQGSFQTYVQGVLAAQAASSPQSTGAAGASTSERLGAEFAALAAASAAMAQAQTNILTGVSSAGHGGASAVPGGSKMTQTQLKMAAKTAKEAFRTAVRTFVANVRAFTTIDS